MAGFFYSYRMIDLSHLTEKEQEMILAVLKRDTELKKKEEQRIIKLKKTEQDKNKLKYLTGEWFYEKKLSRHKDKTNGTDIIKKSMTQNKPVTILEVTQICPEKPSLLKHETKDVFVPPELSGIIQDVNREDQCHVEENPPSAYSQSKPRPNPFNSKSFELTKEMDKQIQTSENPPTLPQITVNSNPYEESQLSTAKQYQAPQTLAEDHHEVHAEPCSSQVFESHALGIEQGKDVHLSPEAQFITLAEEEGRSVNKVLGWFGKISRDSNKRREKPANSEEPMKEGPETHESPKTENTSPPPTEIKTKPSPMPRRGLIALLLKKEPKIETLENKVAEDDLIGPNDNYKQDITFVGQLPDTSSNAEVDDNDVKNSTLIPNMATEEHEEIPFLFITEDSLDNTANNNIQKAAHPDEAEKSHSQLVSLKSLLEKGSKGPKFLSVKQQQVTSHTGMPEFTGNENKALEQKMLEVNINPSKFESAEGVCRSHKGFPKSYRRTSCGGNFSVTPSHEKPVIPEFIYAAQNPGEHEFEIKRTIEKPPSSQTEHIDNSQIKRLDEILLPVPAVRKTLIPKNEPATTDNLRSLKKKDNSCPKIIISSHDCVPHISVVTSPRPFSQEGIKSPVDVSSASPNLLSSPEIKSTTLNRQVNEMTVLSEEKDRQSPTKVTVDDANKMPCMTLSEYPIRAHKSVLDESSQSPSSSSILNISSGIQDHNELSIDDNLMQVSVQPTTLSPRQMPKVPTREFYPIKESRMIGSPLRAFSIDISPIKKIQVESFEHMHTTRDRTRCPHGQSNSEESCPGTDGNDLAKRSEQDLTSSSRNTSKQYQLPSLKSSSHSREPQSPGNVSIDVGECPSPVRRTTKQLNVRPISISKSLEDLVTQPLNERWKNDSRSDIMEDTSQIHLPVIDPEKMKRLSMSVPGFLQQQGIGEESDCLSMDSFCSDRRRKSSTNFSASSGHASLSSVSGSRMNIHGSYFGNVEVKGTIQFAINYVNSLEELNIFIVRCRDLAAAEPKRNRSDPYVKCYLLPDKAKQGKKKTSVKKKTLNPTYNEILRYKVPMESLKVHTLNLSVWHHDMFGRNSFLGEVNVDLAEWDIENTQMMDCELKARASTPSSPTHVYYSLEKNGEMRVALRFLLQTSQSNKTPLTGEVQVWIKECKNLSSRRGTVDSFVKCSFLPDCNQKGRQKSRVVKKTANPVFNHTMVYDGLRPEDLKETCVELTVWNHDRLSSHFIGGIRLSLGTGKSHSSDVNWMDSSSAEAELWKRLIESVNEWVEDALPLRMLLMARIMPR